MKKGEFIIRQFNEKHLNDEVCSHEALMDIII